MRPKSLTRRRPSTYQGAYAVTNRLAVVVIALVVGAGLFVGATAVEDLIAADPGVPAEGEVLATNTTTHLDRVGRPTAVGEVLNGLEDPIGDVSVTVTFHRDDGGEERVAVPTAIATVRSGARVPFVARLENRSARVESVDVAVTYEVGAGRPYDGLEVVEDRVVERTESQVTLAGRVANRGDTSVEASVVATFYDEDGSVVGVRSVPTSPSGLDGAASGEFVVRYRTLGNVPSRAGEVDRYDLALRAVRLEGEDS